MADNYTPHVKRMLRNAGCRFVRQGRGDHEIWYSPITRRHFIVDGRIKSRHWANFTLKQAGLPKAFRGHVAPKPASPASARGVVGRRREITDIGRVVRERKDLRRACLRVVEKPSGPETAWFRT
jgi:hypothetical protein